MAGGFFGRAGEEPASGVARWDGERWHPLGSGVDGPVFALTEYQGRLVVGGAFHTAGGYPAAGIAAWDGRGWTPMGSGVDGEVCALQEWNGDLYVGGEFGTAGGRASYHLARWHGVDPVAMFTDLTATRTPQGIRVRWDTRELPFDHQGFLVYREGFDGERERLTATRREGTSGQFLDDDAPPGAAIYWIAGEAATGRIVWYRSVTVSQAPGLRLTLSPNSPNPFPASGTTLAFVNGVEGRVTLTVFDVSGRIVNRLMDRTLPPGGYDVFWDGRDTAGHGVSSGVYFYRLAGPEGILTRRMIRVP